MLRNRPISLALVGLFVWVTACQTYTQIEIGEVANHGKVRVTLADGERETVRDPRVESDSIKGLGKKAGIGVSDRLSLAMPVDEVVKIETVRTDEVGTVFTTLGVFVGTVVVIWAVACTIETEDSYACAW